MSVLEHVSSSGVLLLAVVVLLHVPFPSMSAQHGVTQNNSPTTKKDISDDDGLMVVDDEEEEVSAMDVFVATKEWQVVKEGQSIPPGLHVRMNLQTGLKEAKLLDKESVNETGNDNADSADMESSADEPDDGETTPLESHPTGAKFTGDNRRTHYLGKSDRRGIVNKKTKVFTRRELMEAINQEEDGEGGEHMLLTAQESGGKDANIRTTSHKPSSERTFDGDSTGKRQSELPYTLHEDVETMLDHSRTLAKREATITELVHALEELEYHVHNMDNAKDFTAIGGLVLVIRQLNHSSPDVRSHAAHVIGAASQRYE